MQIVKFSSQDLSLHLDGFSDLLTDAVNNGASVGFLSPLSHGTATQWWEGLIPEIDSGDILLLGALTEGKIIGTIQLHLARKENAPHRAEVAKLMVHSSARGKGAGKALMLKAEELAREKGRCLLTLDTEVGSIAEKLYRSLDYQAAGVIPEFALLPDQSKFAGTLIMWKKIS